MEKVITGRAYVLGHDIDTDQIIPAEHLIYNPSDPAERKMFGKHSLCGVPPAQAGLPQGNVRFVEEGRYESDFRVLIGGDNFGCGSSREHAPLSIAEAGVRVVVANFYARIFYRNCVNGGYLIPFEAVEDLTTLVATGDEMELLVEEGVLINHTQGTRHQLRPLGDILPILEAGDVFEYAKSVGMLKA
jgi:3-isopropylmalate/(R)-2-methylmalate dehydratase small subunit